MHKLIDYICDELETLEAKAGKGEKLTMAEVEYMDTLAHAKKNLLKGEEMMGDDYSHMEPIHSYARGRGRGAKRDAMGRYSTRYSMYPMSYADDMKDMVDSIHRIMPDLPDDVKHDAQNFVKKLEHVM